jgi:glucose uptake protein GlcU
LPTQAQLHRAEGLVSIMPKLCVLMLRDIVMFKNWQHWTNMHVCLEFLKNILLIVNHFFTSSRDRIEIFVIRTLNFCMSIKICVYITSGRRHDKIIKRMQCYLNASDVMHAKNLCCLSHRSE